MQRNVVAIGPHTLLRDAVELLIEHRISGLPVTDDEGRVVGIITEFALLAWTLDKSAGEAIVGQYMTRHVITVDERQLLSDVVDIFILNRIRRVPVTSKGKLTGIISRRDLMRAAQQSHGSFARTEPFATKVEAGLPTPV